MGSEHEVHSPDPVSCGLICVDLFLCIYSKKINTEGQMCATGRSCVLSQLQNNRIVVTGWCNECPIKKNIFYNFQTFELKTLKTCILKINVAFIFKLIC